MSQPSSSPGESPIINAYRGWAAVCPFASRNMMMLVAGSWVVGLIIPGLDFSLSNTPLHTVSGFEIYRLITSLLSSGNLITVIFSLMTFNQMGPRLESSLGSTGMLALMLTLTLAMNIAFIMLCGLFKVLGDESAWARTASGFWNLLIALIAVECMASPDVPRRFFILPMDIPGKYYPLFLTALFSLMRGRWFDLWCAVGVGYAYAAGKLDAVKASRATLIGWENGCLSNFVRQHGYITTNSAVGAAAWAPVNNPADHPSNQARASEGGFSSFFGGSRGSGGGSDGFGGGAVGGASGSENDGGEAGFGSKNVIRRGANGGSANGTSSSTGGNAFGGSGQTLGGGGGGMGAILSGRGHARHDPEAARAARLAALEARGAGGGEGGSGAAQRVQGDQVVAETSTLMSPSDLQAGIQALQDMGFPAAEARYALERSDGDVDAAISYLSSP